MHEMTSFISSSAEFDFEVVVAMDGKRWLSECECFCCGLKGHVKRWCKLNDSHCEYCGTIGHVAATCWRKKLKCYCCGNVGHIKRDCEYRERCCGLCGKAGHVWNTCWSVKEKAGKHDVEDNKKPESREEEPLVVTEVKDKDVCGVAVEEEKEFKMMIDETVLVETKNEVRIQDVFERKKLKIQLNSLLI